jgi:hypothetical protein
MTEAPTSDACRVCRNTAVFVFAQPILGEMASYFECGSCGYLQTEQPGWLERAYADAINDADTGIMRRNRENVGRVAMTLLAYNLLHGRVVDHAGGYGILVRLLRDDGIDARWRDKYCVNLLARGFEAEGTGFDLLTAFEMLEHVLDPVAEIDGMLADADVAVVSTELIQTAETPRADWWYLGPGHGQHIGFFRRRTLALIADKVGCAFASDGRSLHLFSRRRIPSCWRTLQRFRRLWPLVGPSVLRSRTLTDLDLINAAKSGHAKQGHQDP